MGYVGEMLVGDYFDFFGVVLFCGEVCDCDVLYLNILIWGIFEVCV